MRPKSVMTTTKQADKHSITFRPPAPPGEKDSISIDMAPQIMTIPLIDSKVTAETIQMALQNYS